MSENQVVRRQQVRLCERPRKHGKWQFPTRVSLRGGKVRVTKEEKLARRDLTLADVVRAQQAFRDYYLRSDKPFLRMQCQARNSVDGIVSRLDRLRDDEDFIPDVIVIDYVDLLDAPKGIREKRDQINENWRALRELSLKQHCLVVTATQSNAKAHKLEKQGRSSFSDNQLKQAHVTAMVGINSNSIEIVENVSRLEYIVVREGPHREGFQVGIVSCLEIASPIVRSCYVK